MLHTLIETLPGILIIIGLGFRLLLKKQDVSFALYGAGFLLLGLQQLDTKHVVQGYIALLGGIIAFALIFLLDQSKPAHKR